MTQMPKGPYREVLDWLVEQVDRLESHTERLASEAELGEADREAIRERREAIAQAHAWLNDQLRRALVDRGMDLAA